MSATEPTPKRKPPLLPLLALGALAGAAAVLVLRGVDLRALLESMIGFIRDLGAPAFFLAMIVLPAVGMPMMAFTITAGEAFSPQLGMAGVITASLVCIAINLALGYWVARYALRPLLARLMTRYGYKVPRVTPENALTVTLLVRLTPGPPYPLQACVLGLAEVPFRLYLLVSWLVMVPWTLGAIMLGKGLFSGKFGVAATGVGVLVVAILLVQIVLRRLAARRQAEELKPAPESATTGS